MEGMSRAAFEETFLRAMKRAIRWLTEDEESFKEVKSELKRALRRHRISKKEVKLLADQIPPYVFGSLAADIAIGAILEGSSRERRIQKIIADVFVRVLEEKAIQTLLKHCNIEAAQRILGEETVEEIAEKVTTIDLYQTKEYERLCKAVTRILEETLK